MFGMYPTPETWLVWCFGLGAAILLTRISAMIINGLMRQGPLFIILYDLAGILLSAYLLLQYPNGAIDSRFEVLIAPWVIFCPLLSVLNLVAIHELGLTPELYDEISKPIITLPPWLHF